MPKCRTRSPAQTSHNTTVHGACGAPDLLARAASVMGFMLYGVLRMYRMCVVPVVVVLPGWKQVRGLPWHRAGQNAATTLQRIGLHTPLGTAAGRQCLR